MKKMWGFHRMNTVPEFRIPTETDRAFMAFAIALKMNARLNTNDSILCLKMRWGLISASEKLNTTVSNCTAAIKV